MATASSTWLPQQRAWLALFEPFSNRSAASGAPTEDQVVAEVEVLLNSLRDQGHTLLDDYEAAFDQYVSLEERAAELDGGAADPWPAEFARLRDDLRDRTRSKWADLCAGLAIHERDATIATFRDTLRRQPAGRVRRVGLQVVNEFDRLRERNVDLIRYLVISAPELDLEVPEHLAVSVWTVPIPPLAYLRAMWNLWWSAIRHPLSETTIDLSTGRVLCRA